MDIFNAATINDLLILSEYGENSGNDFTEEPTLIRKILLAKVLVDRWENIVTDMLFHESQKDKVLKELGEKVYFSTDDDPNLWGATLHFMKNIPVDKVVILSLIDDELNGSVPSRAVAAFSI